MSRLGEKLQFILKMIETAATLLVVERMHIQGGWGVNQYICFVLEELVQFASNSGATVRHRKSMES